MNKPRKKPLPKPRKVWRITELAPQGEWVDPRQPAPRRAVDDVPPEESSSGWVLSSFDLLRGADVSEDRDTVPDALFDELFGRPDEPPDQAPK